MTTFAHLGHWYFQLAFAAPALILIGWMARDSLRRHRDERPPPEGGEDEPAPGSQEAPPRTANRG